MAGATSECGRLECGQEISRTGLVHGGIVGHVGDEDVHLDNVLEAAARGFQRVLDVFQSLVLVVVSGSVESWRMVSGENLQSGP